MSNVINFIERIGADPQLLHATAEEMEAALARADIPPAFRSAILRKDLGQLATLLDAPANVCCMIEAVDMGDDASASKDTKIHSLGAVRGAAAI